MKQTKLKMTKPIYLGPSVLGISKTIMYKFWYDYIEPKYEGTAKLCYMDTDSFVIYIETEDYCKGIVDDVGKWFDTSNYDKKNQKTSSNW